MCAAYVSDYLVAVYVCDSNYN